MLSELGQRFAAVFGEDDAYAVMGAAEKHKNGIHDNPGSDYFRWALCICIGYECLRRFRDYHGINASEADLDEWIKAHADLGSHDGDIDYLAAALVGAYDPYLNRDAS